MLSYGVRAALLGVAIGAAVLLLVGIPTEVLSNPWFTRMTPVRPQDYVFLAATALLAAVFGATNAFPSACPRQENKLAVGGLLSTLAVGCPLCNKVVVLLLGVSGALSYFQPLQPLLALASIGLMIFAIRLRLRAITMVPAAG